MIELIGGPRDGDRVEWNGIDRSIIVYDRDPHRSPPANFYAEGRISDDFGPRLIAYHVDTTRMGTVGNRTVARYR